jgi:hypothetical protein
MSSKTEEEEEITMTDQVNGAPTSKSEQPVEMEYRSHFNVPALSPDHSPPDHKEYFNDYEGTSSRMLRDLDVDPFGRGSSPPPFEDAFSDTLLNDFRLNYTQPYIRNGASSSNEASPASSSGAGAMHGPWPHGDDSMNDIPDLDDVDTYAHHYSSQRNRVEDIDSDNLDDDPSPPNALTTSDSAVPPSASPTPARETAPSPPSVHNGDEHS